MARDPSKAELRKRIAARRSGIADAVRRSVGEAIAGHVACLPELTSAERVALFAGLPDEPDTLPIFERLVEAGHVVHLPRAGVDGRLDFVPVSAWEDLRPGRYGVLEPAPERAPVAAIGLELALIPGVAFDREGRRLGRGAGYYDRTFPARTDGPILVGVAFELQLVECVPVGPHDRSVMAVITEKGIIRMSGSRGDQAR